MFLLSIAIRPKSDAVSWPILNANNSSVHVAINISDPTVRTNQNEIFIDVIHFLYPL